MNLSESFWTDVLFLLRCSLGFGDAQGALILKLAS